jgi:uncharacterized membrane protein YkvA (DUF1232 family)
MMNESEKYGYAIRLILQRKNMKAEELISLINKNQTITINKSALSRIMTGRRLLTQTEAKSIAKELDSPILFEAFQYLKEYVETNSGVSALKFHEVIDPLLNEEATQDELVEPAIDYSLLQQMINRLYRYCLVQDVSGYIREGFLSKVAQVRGLGEMIERLTIMYHGYFNGNNLSIKDRAWVASALLYFISPIDLIPDHLLPFGYIDDAVVVAFVFNKLSSVLMDYRNQFNSGTINSEMIQTD